MNNIKFCKHCGKKLVKKKIKRSDRKKGWEWETTLWFKNRLFCDRTCSNKHRIKEKHPQWRGGIKTDSNGRIFIHIPEHPNADHQGYIRRSHLVMEKKIGRYLTPKEIVHHRNGIKNDDKPENLYLFENCSEHQKLHYSERKKDTKGRFTKCVSL